LTVNQASSAARAVTDSSTSYRQRRSWLTEYFDRTAAAGWTALTSDAPVSRIRATVRAGRARMRETLLSWLPRDLSGLRVLDAGCGTGMATLELARRGASVVAIDLAPTAVQVAEERAASETFPGRIEWRSGDMLSAELGEFDHVFAMDSLIHYQLEDVMHAVSELATRTHRSIVATYAPSTPLLELMHTVGRLVPHTEHTNRAPAIEPLRQRSLYAAIASAPTLGDWTPARTTRVQSVFYISQALELVRSTTSDDDDMVLGVGA
jgi:magnesium-protoporphyrin O-methyltransferase